MRDRHDRFSLLGVTYTSLLMNVCFEGINTMACTDQTGLDNFDHVTQMCKTGTVRNPRVVIDTWGTEGPDIYNCTCIVTLDTGSAPATATTKLTVREYPGVEPISTCGSKLRISSTKSSSFTETRCIPIPATPQNQFASGDMLTLTLSRIDVSTQWQSGHCILISQDILSYNVIVTCSNATPITITTKPTTTTPQPTTLTPQPTTTTPKPTTTTPQPTTTTPKPTTTTPQPTTTTSVSRTTTTTPTPTQPPIVSSTGDTAAESTTAGGQIGSGANTDKIETGIIAGAAGGGGLLLIIIIVVIVIIRKRRPCIKQPFDPGNMSHDNINGALCDDIQPYATTAPNNRYNDGDTLTHNSLYVSAGPEKRFIVDANDTEKLELEETPPGVVYAVVNKPKKEDNNDETEDNRLSRYTNPDGLVYAEVGVQDRTSRQKSRVTSCPPPVSPKPKTNTDNVMYAEVNTSV